MKRLLMSAISVVVIIGSISAQSTKVDVTGVWLFTIMSELGTGTPTVTFKQEGEKLTGHYSSQLVGEADLTGTVKGQTIEFVISAELQGTKLEFKYTGTVDGKEMKGNLSAGDLGGGTFTAKRKE